MTSANEPPRWWTMRRAQSAKPATYRCPFCGERLHAMSEHVLVAPEGDVDRRRHAHLDCVRRERAAGRLATEDEYRDLVTAKSQGENGLVTSKSRGRGGAGIVGRLWRRFGR